MTTVAKEEKNVSLSLPDLVLPLSTPVTSRRRQRPVQLHSITEDDDDQAEKSFKSQVDGNQKRGTWILDMFNHVTCVNRKRRSQLERGFFSSTSSSFTSSWETTSRLSVSFTSSGRSTSRRPKPKLEWLGLSVGESVVIAVCTIFKRVISRVKLVCIAGVFAVAILEKVGPRCCGLIGAALMSGGLLLTAIAPNIYTIYVTYGIIAGQNLLILCNVPD